MKPQEELIKRIRGLESKKEFKELYDKALWRVEYITKIQAISAIKSFLRGKVILEKGDLLTKKDINTILASVAYGVAMDDDIVWKLEEKLKSLGRKACQD